MKLLFVKILQVHDGLKWHDFKRMKVYNLSEQYAEEIIAEGFACKFGFMSELPVTAEYPKEATA